MDARENKDGRQRDGSRVDDRENIFQDFLRERFPSDKCRTSGVYHQAFGERVVKALKDSLSCNKNFRFWIKKKGFKLLDIPSLGAREVLVVPVKEKEVRTGYSNLPAS